MGAGLLEEQPVFLILILLSSHIIFCFWIQIFSPFIFPFSKELLKHFLQDRFPRDKYSQFLFVGDHLYLV